MSGGRWIVRATSPIGPGAGFARVQVLGEPEELPEGVVSRGELGLRVHYAGEEPRRGDVGSVVLRSCECCGESAAWFEKE